MKKYLPYLFAFIFSDLYSQTYFPFPDSNAVWSVLPFGPMGTGSYYILNKGDSIHNSITYKKYFQTPDNNFSPASFQYLGMVRQDIPNKKVFCIFKGTNAEKLLYDFSLKVDDTVTVNGYADFLLKVDSLDSILLAGQYRKRIWLSAFKSYVESVMWIEGIGSHYEPLQPVMFVIYDAVNPRLLCQTESNNLIYKITPASSCYVPHTVGLEKNHVNFSSVIFPNPSNDFINVNPPVGFENYTLKIQDVSCREIETKEITGGQGMQLQTDTYQPGIYIFSLIQNGIIIERQKVVIIK